MEKLVASFLKSIAQKFDDVSSTELDTLLMKSITFSTVKKTRSSGSGGTCTYKFKKGGVSGTTCKSAEHTNGLCSRHYNQTQKSNAKPQKEKKATKTNRKKGNDNDVSVIHTLHEKKPKLMVRMGSHGNFILPDSNIVIDKVTKKAIGVENADGLITPLTKAEIDICKIKKILYEIPLQLSGGEEEKKERKKEDKEEKDDDEDDLDEEDGIVED